jgi:hypothetical protein
VGLLVWSWRFKGREEWAYRHGQGQGAFQACANILCTVHMYCLSAQLRTWLSCGIQCVERKGVAPLGGALALIELEDPTCVCVAGEGGSLLIGEGGGWQRGVGGEGAAAAAVAL